MDRYRLIASIVVLFIYLLAMFPVQTIIIAIVLAVGYFVLSNMGQGRLGELSTAGNGREVRRREALQTAKIFLSPYRDIWRNLKLTNKFCYLKLWADGNTITARELVGSKRSFRITKSKVHSNSDLWDMFCMSFSHNTNFDELLKKCETFQVELNVQSDVVKTVQNNVVYPKTTKSNERQADIIPTKDSDKEKLDINNASEVEITALPGISIVLAKKIIKKREEIGGFKSVDDVCLFLHLKPHIEKQLREHICINKMKGSLKISRNNERSVDI